VIPMCGGRGFPELFRASYVDYAHCHIRYTTQAVPENLANRCKSSRTAN
jgi:hypothetical protein